MDLFIFYKQQYHREKRLNNFDTNFCDSKFR